jgi:hypothetical protein
LYLGKVVKDLKQAYLRLGKVLGNLKQPYLFLGKVLGNSKQPFRDKNDLLTILDSFFFANMQLKNFPAILDYELPLSFS